MFSLNAGVSILTILFVSSGLVQGSPNGTLRQLVTDSDKNTSNIDPPFDSNNPKFHTESSVFQASIDAETEKEADSDEDNGWGFPGRQKAGIHPTLVKATLDSLISVNECCSCADRIMTKTDLDEQGRPLNSTANLNSMPTIISGSMSCCRCSRPNIPPFRRDLVKKIINSTCMGINPRQKLKILDEIRIKLSPDDPAMTSLFVDVCVSNRVNPISYELLIGKLTKLRNVTISMM